MSSVVRKFKFLLLRVRYQGFRLWLHYVRFLENLLESLIRSWLLKGELLHSFVNNSQPYQHSENLDDQKFGKKLLENLIKKESDPKEKNILKKHDNVILSAFGAGFTWGATYLKWSID